MIRFRGYSLAQKLSQSVVSSRFSSTSASYERKNHILPYSADVVIIGKALALVLINSSPSENFLSNIKKVVVLLDVMPYIT